MDWCLPMTIWLVFNLWGNSPGSYSLFDVSGPPDAHVYFQDNGIAPIAPVPEPTTAGCFLLGLGALVCCQRFIKTGVPNKPA